MHQIWESTPNVKRCKISEQIPSPSWKYLSNQENVQGCSFSQQVQGAEVGKTAQNAKGCGAWGDTEICEHLADLQKSVDYLFTLAQCRRFRFRLSNTIWREAFHYWRKVDGRSHLVLKYNLLCIKALV